MAEFLKLSEDDLTVVFENDSALVDRIYSDANAAFESEEYAESIKLYQLLVFGNQASETLYLNLGTAYFRNGSPGTAALWFRRALHLKPGLPEVRQNFEFLRHKHGLLEFGEEDWQRLLLRVSPTTLGWAIWIPVWISLFAILLLMMGKKPFLNPLLIVIIVFAGSGSAFFTWLSWYRDHHLAPHNFATVVESGTSALVAPAPDSDPIVALPEGSEIRVLQDTGPWIYASIPGELVGWVHHSSIEKNWPILREKTNFLPLGTELSLSEN